MVLITENLAGNLHQAAATINKLGLAKFVLTLSSNGTLTIVVYRMTLNQQLEFKSKGILY
jgi:hypothetical protein